MKTDKVPVNHIDLHTECFGQRADPTIVLIAGAMSTARFWNDEFCEGLAENHFVIRYDHRDIGESDSINWQTSPYSLSDLASDAIGILDHYDIEQAHFIGHSMGGYIVQQIAVSYPDRTKSIIPISAGPINPTPETEEALTEQEQAKLNQTWDVFLSRVDSEDKEDYIQGFLELWRYFNGTYVLDEDLARETAVDLLERNRHELKAENNHEKLMQNVHDTLNQKQGLMKNIQCPTLVISGREDQIILPRYGHAIANQIPHAELIIQPGMGHMFFNRQLQKILLAMIRRQAARFERSSR